MFKYKVIVFILLAAVLTSGEAYCQEKIENKQIKTIMGTVTKVDAVGNVINIQTNKGEMAFYISDQASKIWNTHEIGLLDIKEDDPVTIQYTSSSLGKNSVISLVDNKSRND